MSMLDQENSIITTTLVERQSVDTLTMLKMILARTGTGDGGGSSNSSSSSSSNLDDAANKIKGLEKKIVHYKDVFTKLRQKYKDVVYQLTGWKISMDLGGTVKIASMYATSEQDQLHFKVEGEDISLVQNSYSKKLEGGDTDALLVLRTTQSYPGCLATLTSELLEQTTLNLGGM